MGGGGEGAGTGSGGRTDGTAEGVVRGRGDFADGGSGLYVKAADGDGDGVEVGIRGVGDAPDKLVGSVGVGTTDGLIAEEIDGDGFGGEKAAVGGGGGGAESAQACAGGPGGDGNGGCFIGIGPGGGFAPVVGAELDDGVGLAGNAVGGEIEYAVATEVEAGEDGFAEGIVGVEGGGGDGGGDSVQLVEGLGRGHRPVGIVGGEGGEDTAAIGGLFLADGAAGKTPAMEAAAATKNTLRPKLPRRRVPATGTRLRKRFRRPETGTLWRKFGIGEQRCVLFIRMAVTNRQCFLFKLFNKHASFNPGNYGETFSRSPRSFQARSFLPIICEVFRIRTSVECDKASSWSVNSFNAVVLQLARARKPCNCTLGSL